jgi:RecA-family ATPase
VGKSMFLRQMAVAIVKGEESFLGFKINAQNRNVIIVSTEDDDTSTSFLLRKQLGEMEDTSALTRLRYIFDTYDIPKKLRQTLDQQPADLIILDAFSDLYSDEMNNVYKVRKFLNDYHAIAKKYDCLIAFLHHTGKRTEDGTPSKNNVIGSQGFEAKMRTVLELRRDMNDDTIRHLCAVKGNYLKDSDKNKSFILKFEEMTYTNTGDRQAFSKLGKADNKLEENQKIKTRVHALKKEKKSVRGITKILKDEGMKIGKTKVAEILKDEMSESFIPEVKDGGQVE